MASPQTENGYTRIANEIMEKFARTRINGEARQILDVILRKTYGWGKKEDKISLSQFCLATELKKPTVCKGIKKLLKMNLITQKGNDWQKIYGLNKDFETWKVLPKRIIVTQKGNEYYPKGQKVLPKRLHTKEKKETKTKEIRMPSSAEDGDIVQELLEERGGIQHDYQYLGLEVYEKLNAPPNKKGECIRIARDYAELVQRCLSFALDYPNPALKWKMFLWKLSELRKNVQKNTTIPENGLPDRGTLIGAP